MSIEPEKPMFNLNSVILNKPWVRTWYEMDDSRSSSFPEITYFVLVETMYREKVLSKSIHLKEFDLKYRRNKIGDFYTYDYWVWELAVPTLMSKLFSKIGRIKNEQQTPSI